MMTMTNKERLQQHNNELIECIGLAEAGGSSPSGASSWNDLTDKPFGLIPHEPIVWDGNTDGKEIVQIDSTTQWVLVSEEYFTADQLIGETYTIGGNVFDITETDVRRHGDGVVEHNYFISFPAPIGKFTIPGTYFAYINDGETFVSELTTKKIKKISEKYLPYVVITEDMSDNSFSCNVSDIFTLIKQLNAYPLIFYRRLDADFGHIVWQTLMGGYWLNYGDNGEIASVSLLNGRGNEILNYGRDGIIISTVE